MAGRRWAAWTATVGVLVLAMPVAADEPPLQALSRRLVGADQGVFARSEDGRVLAAVAADRPVHPASVSKPSLRRLSRLTRP